MWTLIKIFLGRLTLRQVAAVCGFLLLVCVGSGIAIRVSALKTELVSAQQSLVASASNLGACQATLDQYAETTKRLEQEHREALEKAAKVSVRTRQLVSATRSRPVDNTTDSIRQEGLQTAPEAVDLWTR